MRDRDKTRPVPITSVPRPGASPARMIRGMHGSALALETLANYIHSISFRLGVKEREGEREGERKGKKEGGKKVYQQRPLYLTTLSSMPFESSVKKLKKSGGNGIFFLPARARRFVAVLLAGDISKVCDSRLTRRFESIFAHRPWRVQRMDGEAFSNNTYLWHGDLSFQHLNQPVGEVFFPLSFVLSLQSEYVY